MRGRRQSRDLGARPARLFESRSWHPRACQDLKRRSPRGAARRGAREETETRGETEADASERAPVCFRVGVVRRVDACARVPLPRDPSTVPLNWKFGSGRSDGQHEVPRTTARCPKSRRGIRETRPSFPPRYALHLRSFARDDGAHDLDTIRHVVMHITHFHAERSPPPRAYRRLSLRSFTRRGRRRPRPARFAQPPRRAP